MGDRSRLRVGRGVLYTPTAAEATASGEGPWAARIAAVNSDGSVDLHVLPPTVETAVPAAGADPLITQADANANGATYVQADVVSIEALANANKIGINLLVTLVNAMRSETVGARKTSIVLGGGLGEFSLEGRSDI